MDLKEFVETLEAVGLSINFNTDWSQVEIQAPRKRGRNAWLHLEDTDNVYNNPLKTLDFKVEKTIDPWSIDDLTLFLVDSTLADMQASSPFTNAWGGIDRTMIREIAKIFAEELNNDDNGG